jgi:hypothetical protein
MSRMSRLIPALVAVVFMAACSDTGSSLVGPEGASFDDGVGSAGGNRSDTTTATTTTSTTTSSDTTSRGVGSAGGN